MNAIAFHDMHDAVPVCYLENQDIYQKKQDPDEIPLIVSRRFFRFSFLKERINAYPEVLPEKLLPAGKK